jgi:hypothetical protein
VRDLYLVLRAYVREDGVVIHHHDYGSVTLHDIFLLRPDMCRYAVARDGPKHLCIDMYDCTLENYRVQRCSYKSFDSLEAAIMAASLTLT